MEYVKHLYGVWQIVKCSKHLSHKRRRKGRQQRVRKCKEATTERGR